MATIAEQWKSFEDAVMPKDAGIVQRREMRRAFYAGAQSTLGLLTRLTEAGMSDDAGAFGLELLHAECDRFGKQVQAGEA